jgi:hypothetical protein
MNGRVETMAGHLHKVTFKEQLIICHVIREYSGEQKYAHLSPALLPFVSMEQVRSSLRAKRASRPIATIISKIGPVNPPYLNPVWLNNRKVVKVFGADPAKGRRFNWLPKTTIWGHPIDPVVSLKFVRLNKRPSDKSNTGAMYDVVVHEAYREPVVAWLLDNLT